jgi:2-amino-4-hydroxy-6-hydroxymethyldihydropteridine diphosphokinase
MAKDGEAIIALGGNIGNVVENFASALCSLRASGLKITATSSLYRTAPWGKTDQPDFLNMCASVQTSLSAHDLLHLCLAVEQAHGRKRQEQWGPRTLDLDLIDYDGQEISDKELNLPHPRAHERAFVLFPLADIRPHLIVAGKSVAWHVSHCDQSGVMRDDEACARFAALFMRSSTS